jgi:hypothetical protein
VTLSPAAQAVLDAANGANSYGPDDCLNESRWIAAAALRAASDRTMSLIGDICHPKYMEGIEASSDFLDHIAAELEGGQ